MKIAIIGGAGQMGEWFSRFFIAQGHTVVISGRNKKRLHASARRTGAKIARDNISAVSGADLVILSVLVGGMEKVLKETAPHLTAKQRIIDITSVKELPVKLMHRHMANRMTLGTHPMFGPSAQAKGQNFILTPTNRKEREVARWFTKVLGGSGFNIIVMSPKKHDEMIGFILSLTHFVGLVTADSWKRLKIDKYMGSGSTSFNFLFRFAKSVVDSNPELYSYLQMYIPSVNHAESVFIRSANEWSSMVRRKQRGRFMTRMKGVSQYLNGLKSG